MDTDVRASIVEATLVILAEVGPSRLRIQEVARRADVSATLLYYYFESKNSLIAAAYAHDYAMICARDAGELTLVLAESSDVETFIAKMADLADSLAGAELRSRRLAVLAAAYTDPALAQAIRASTILLYETLRTVIDEAILRGWVDAEVDAASLAVLLMSAGTSKVLTDLTPEIGVESSRLLRSALRLSVAPHFAGF